MKHFRPFVGHIPSGQLYPFLPQLSLASDIVAPHHKFIALFTSETCDQSSSSSFAPLDPTVAVGCGCGSGCGSGSG